MSANPGKNSKEIFDAEGLKKVPKTTRNEVPRGMEWHILFIKRPPKKAKRREKENTKSQKVHETTDEEHFVNWWIQNP